MSYEQRIGDFRFICDRSGFLGWASESVVEPDGRRVLRRFADLTRHPQDFATAVPDDTSVNNPRPEGADVFLTPGDVTPDDL